MKSAQSTTVQVVSLLSQGPRSGQALAETLGISRAAVHKAVEQLRAHGFGVEAHAGQGYQLTHQPNLLCAEVMTPHLDENTLGHAQWTHLDETPSTNSVASEQARQGAPQGAVVVAEHQTAGRGRRGRTFVSPHGTGLYFSVVLRPQLPPQQAFRLTLCGALAVQEALTQLGVNAQLKWPNDVVVQGRKLCGVLTELSADAERIHQAVVGVGVNVNTPADAFPEELRGVATSVMLEHGQPVDRGALFVRVLQCMTRWYRLSVMDFPKVVAAARACSHTLGRTVKVKDGDLERVGTALDLDEDGALVLQTADGVVRVVSGDVEPVDSHGARR